MLASLAAISLGQKLCFGHPRSPTLATLSTVRLSSQMYNLWQREKRRNKKNRKEGSRASSTEAAAEPISGALPTAIGKEKK